MLKVVLEAIYMGKVKWNYINKIKFSVNSKNSSLSKSKLYNSGRNLATKLLE